MAISKITQDLALPNKVEHIFAAFSDDAIEYPFSVLSTLNAYLEFSIKDREIKISGDVENEISTYLHQTFRPYDVWTIDNEGATPFSI